MASHLKLPLSVSAAGSLSVLAQDSAEEIAQSVGLLLATPVGDRRSFPGYGLPDPLGRGLDPSVVLLAVAVGEPRADVDAVEVGLVSASGVQTASVFLGDEGGV